MNDEANVNNNKFTNYKYVHIMLHTAIIHNSTIVELLNNKDIGFKPSEHRFIIQHRNVYEACNKYSNVVLDEEVISRNMKNFIKYSEQSKYIFLHCNELTARQLLKIDKKIMCKIIWCVWGHDLYYVWHSLSEVTGLYKKTRRLAGNIITKLTDIVCTYKNKQMFAIGIGFKYDAIEVKRKYGKDMRVLTTPYGYIINKKHNIDRIVGDRTEHNLNRSYKIMIGHSGFKFLNHIDIMKKLIRFKDESIIISLILSYGDTDYAKKVEKYAISNFKDKVEIIKEFMTADDYLCYLKTVDACILDYKHQSALGNVWRLLYLGKKLYLNKNGIIKMALMLEGIESYNVEDIDYMSFKEFSAPVQDVNNSIKLGTYYIDENTCVDMWKNTLSELS